MCYRKKNNNWKVVISEQAKQAKRLHLGAQRFNYLRSHSVYCCRCRRLSVNFYFAFFCFSLSLYRSTLPFRSTTRHSLLLLLFVSCRAFPKIARSLHCSLKSLFKCVASRSRRQMHLAFGYLIKLRSHLAIELDFAFNKRNGDAHRAFHVPFIIYKSANKREFIGQLSRSLWQIDSMPGHSSGTRSQ